MVNHKNLFTKHVIACILALSSASCAANEAVPVAIKTPKESSLTLDKKISTKEPEDESKTNWSEIAKEIIINALSLSGTQYKYGGSSPDAGFDCSGFVRYVFQQTTNLTLPRSALAISKVGQKVQINELKPGDLVFFNTLKSAFSHVGIYIGDNKFIHSPSSGGGVRIENMTSDYWTTRFNGAKRVEITNTETH